MSDRPSAAIVGLPDPAAELPWSDAFVMQAIELLVATQEAGRIVALRPDCADSFVVGWPAGARPEGVARDTLARLGLPPRVLHSTSWRHGGNEVILTYLAVVPSDVATPESWERVPVPRSDLARGSETAPPEAIGMWQVFEHALRHLCWLSHDDDVVRAALPDWTEALAAYVPEPFRAFGPAGMPGAG